MRVGQHIESIKRQPESLPGCDVTIEAQEKLVQLMERFSKLPERQKGFADGHMSDALKALETGILMAERNAAKHAETRKRAVVRSFRVISSA
jgi:hypothetical protein